MHARGPSFQSGASLRSSKQLSFGTLPGVGMDDSVRASGRTGSTNSALVSSDMPIRRGGAPHSSLAASFRRCVKDWALLLILLGFLAYTEFGVSGRRQYITDRVLEAVQYPRESDTVPSWAVPVYSLLGPPVVICAHGSVLDVTVGMRHTAVLASLFSTAASALSTNVFKVTVGRPRPDFFYRCWPDGVAKFTDLGTNGLRTPDCSPNSHDVEDGYKSFPSGHTSWSFGAFMFLSLYLYHFIRPSGATDSLDIFVAIIPLMVAAWVGMTRIIDNKHNASDVVAGGLLGSMIALVVFYTHFPHGKPPKGGDAFVPPRLAETEMLPV